MLTVIIHVISNKCKHVLKFYTTTRMVTHLKHSLLFQSFKQVQIQIKSNYLLNEEQCNKHGICCTFCFHHDPIAQVHRRAEDEMSQNCDRLLGNPTALAIFKVGMIHNISWVLESLYNQSFTFSAPQWWIFLPKADIIYARIRSTVEVLK